MFGKKTSATALTPQQEAGVTRYTPWQEFSELQRRMDDLFNRAFGYTPLSQLIPANGFNFEPQVDLYETDDALQVLASVPGYTPEQIHIEATPDSISIQGERKGLYDADKGVTHRQGGLSEESRFQVQYTLPAEIDPNKIEATYQNGVLKVQMPKTERARTNTVKVPVKAGS